MAEPVERWHLKKEIQLGHLITTFAVAISAVLYINKIEQRLKTTEGRVGAMQAAEESAKKIVQLESELSTARAAIDKAGKKDDPATKAAKQKHMDAEHADFKKIVSSSSAEREDARDFRQRHIACLVRRCWRPCR